MEDKEFLHWLLERLVNVYGESENVDFVQKLRGIINNYPKGKVSNPAFKEEDSPQRIFKHNKTGKLYELVQEHLLFKDVKDIKRIYTADSFEEEWETIYDWDKDDNLILYKALYDNPDGPYFVRHAEDFFKEFTEVKEDKDSKDKPTDEKFTSSVPKDILQQTARLLNIVNDKVDELTKRVERLETFKRVGF